METPTQSISARIDSLVIEAKRAADPYLADGDACMFLYEQGRQENDTGTFTDNFTRQNVDNITHILMRRMPVINITATETGRPAMAYVPELDGVITAQELANLASSRGVMPPRTMVGDTDVAAMLRTIVNFQWGRSRMNRYFRDHIRRMSVYGWAWMVYEFDDHKKQHKLRHLSPRQVYVDPLANNIDEAAYCVVDIWWDMQAAQAKWPEHAGKLAAMAQSGTMQAQDGNSDIPYALEEIQFERNMVRVRTAWIRDEPGKDGPYLRQITKLDDVVLADQPCECWDIPLILTICNPLLDHPFGQGEPMVTRDIQTLTNLTFSTIANYCKDSQNTPVILPEKVYDALQSRGVFKAWKGSRLPNGDRLGFGFPDDILEKMQNYKPFMEPPPMPSGIERIHEMLQAKAAQRSGVTDALMGEGNAGESGTAIANRQYAALNGVAPKAVNVEDSIWRCIMLMKHAIATRMTVEDVNQIIASKPRAIIGYAHGRWGLDDWDIVVELDSGSGAVRQAQRAEDRQKMLDGIIAPETYAQRCDEDYDYEHGLIADRAKQANPNPAQPSPAPPAAGDQTYQSVSGDAVPLDGAGNMTPGSAMASELAQPAVEIPQQLTTSPLS